MNGHTAGPWMYEDCEAGEYIDFPLKDWPESMGLHFKEVSGNLELDWEGHIESGTTVAYHAGPTSPEAEADMRLIAASPDLLAELHATVHMLAEYAHYGEEMKAIGHGFCPKDEHGRSAEVVIKAAHEAILKCF